MFDRVVVDVFHVSAPIFVIAQRVFPKSWLPSPGLAECGRHEVFDEPPACGEFIIVGWQSPDCVEVVRQQHHGVHHEWTLAHDVAEREAQAMDGCGIREPRLALVGNDGEKEPSTGFSRAAIATHATMMRKRSCVR